MADAGRRPELRDEFTQRSLVFGSALFHLKKFSELLEVVRDVACDMSAVGRSNNGVPLGSEVLGNNLCSEFVGFSKAVSLLRHATG